MSAAISPPPCSSPRAPQFPSSMRHAAAATWRWRISARFYVSYETAACRLTNLATHHLGILTHFINSDEDGLIWKGYENDGFPFAHDPYGGVEGQRARRHWGARAVFGSRTSSASTSNTPTLRPARSGAPPTFRQTAPHHGITLGTDFDHARFFRGRDRIATPARGAPNGLLHDARHRVDRALGGECLGLIAGAEQCGHRSHRLPIPQVEMAEVYEFVERHA